MPSRCRHASHRPPTRGSVGYDPGRGDRALRARIGVVLQSGGIQEELTVGELLEMRGRWYPRSLSPARLIELVELDAKADAKAGELSGGQRRRLDLALGLVGDPDVLFLDEPTTGFDPHARRNAWSTLRTLCDTGKTIFLTTHFMDEAQYLADRVAVVNAGEIVAIGPPEALGGRDELPTEIRFVLPDGVGERPARAARRGRRRGARGRPHHDRERARRDARDHRLGARARRRAQGLLRLAADARGRLRRAHGSHRSHAGRLMTARSADLRLAAWQVRYQQRGFWRIMAYAVLLICFNSTALSFASMRTNGILKRVRTTPLPAGAYVAGAVGSTLVVLVLSIALLFVAGVPLFGAHVPGEKMAGMLATLALGAAAFTTLGIAASRLVGKPENGARLVSVVMLPMVFISNIWYPMDGAPACVQDISKALPLRPLADGLQAGCCSRSPTSCSRMLRRGRSRS